MNAKNADKFKDWADLDKPEATVAATLGTTQEKQVKDFFPNAKHKIVEAPARDFQEVLAGRADAHITSNVEAYKLVEKYPQMMIVPVSAPKAPTPIAMLLPQGDQVWINYINTWITLKRERGFFDQNSAGNGSCRSCTHTDGDGAHAAPHCRCSLSTAIPVSLYCAKLRILLRHKGLEWREVPPPGGYGSDEYKLTVPSGNLPALVDGDLQLADSEAIAEYLNEKHPDPAMLPQDLIARAKVRERSRFHDTRLEPALRVLFAYLDTQEPDRSVCDTQSKAITARFGQLACMLDGTGPDDPLTLADCGFPITLSWIEALTPRFGLTVEWPQAVTAYREIIVRHPAVANELAEYRPRLEALLDTPEPE